MSAYRRLIAVEGGNLDSLDTDIDDSTEKEALHGIRCPHLLAQVRQGVQLLLLLRFRRRHTPSTNNTD